MFTLLVAVTPILLPLPSYFGDGVSACGHGEVALTARTRFGWNTFTDKL